MQLPSELAGIPASRSVLEKKQTNLLVDYYRIRRKIAFPLPVAEFYELKIPSKSISGYPWSIWMIWRLEERFHALYNGFSLEKDQACGNMLFHELELFSQWATYNELKSKPDLSTGHCGRILYVALNHWKGIPESVREKLKKACLSLAEENIPRAEAYFKGVTSVEFILNEPKPKDYLHNIGYIGSIGMVLCLKSIGDKRYVKWLETLKIVFRALVIYSREKGYTEGIAYDGYLMDFFLPLAELMTPEEQKEMLDNDVIRNIMDQVIHSSVAGDAGCVAELGDVESKEMIFDITALVKYQKYVATDGFSWYLKNIKADRLSSDAYANLHAQVIKEGSAPKKLIARMPATISLRSGWSADSVSVVTSACNSMAGHIQHDAGTVVIGTKGSWLISDPGYQQYMESSEREYTLGFNAHNFPVINGKAQTVKNSKVVNLKDDGKPFVELDITNCYEVGLANKVTRKIWISDSNRVVISDTILGDKVENIQYFWHGHPEGFWYIDEWAFVQRDGASIWFKRVGATPKPENLNRLKGSRGSLTLSDQIDGNPKTPIYWVFTTIKPSVLPTIKSDGTLMWGKDIFN